MRVLHVIPAVAERYGGPSAAIRGMTQALAARGLDVSVATTNADGSHALDVPLGMPVREHGVTYHYFPRSVPGEWKFSWPLARWLQSHIRDYDVVTVHALFSFSTIPACRMAYRRRVPYIVRPLGTLGEWSLDQRRWKKVPYLAFVERRHLDRAAAVHVTSDAERRSVAALGYGAKARVIPLGVDVTREPRTPRSSGGALRVLYLSRLHPGKNLPILFGALRHARSAGASVFLTIAGSGEPAYVAHLREAAETHGVGDCVEFVGHLSGEAKADAFARADLFVLPSAHENFGISTVEALAAGVPVLVSPHVGVADDVRAAGAGLISEVNEEMLGSSLARLASDPDATLRMGAAAARLARERFSWESCARQLNDVYVELADGAETTVRQAPLAAAGHNG